MSPQKITDRQPFSPFARYELRTKDEARREVSRRCGEFQSPFDTQEALRLFVTRQAASTDMLENVSHVIASGTPLNWQALLRYLRHAGVIEQSDFTFVHARNDIPKLYQVGLPARWDQKKSDGFARPEGGFAHSHSIDIALSKAVGELLERYCLTLYKRDDLTRASYREMRSSGVSAVDIFDLPSFLPWQEQRVPRLGRKENIPIQWIQGETIDGTLAYIPAQLVFWNYDFGSDETEVLLAQPTTSGAGGYFTRDGAVLSGLLELIQRDGFLIYWLNSLSPRRIEVETMDDEDIRQLLSSLKRHRLDVYFLNTTSDIGIPSVTCAIVDRRADPPMLALGGGTGFDLRETILHSAQECLAVINIADTTIESKLPEAYVPFTDAGIGRNERIALWRGATMMKRFDFFLSGEAQTPEEFLAGMPRGLHASPDRLQHVLTKLRQMGEGYEPYLHEVQHPVLKKLGYHVVHTLVPRLMPLYLNENFPTLNARRLREVPARLGYTPAEKYNPWPHPFP